MIRNKRKIINDPVYGFIGIPGELHFDIIEHPYFQRLRRIKQLGLTHLVYPGALHTRFHHAVGAMHIMQQAISVLRSKGHKISEREAEAVSLAILLHDIGHGPFSHALELSLVKGMTHEDLTLLFMEDLNRQFGNSLEMAISIFRNSYPKRFLHQLVSGQLDMDRIDYLNRDSFYTGVSEGVINSDRIIHMLNIVDDSLVVDEKGIYSIEKFIVARRLMYWQVYLHKTVLSAENILIKILSRARELTENGIDIFSTPSLKIFLKDRFSLQDFRQDAALLKCFAELDDFDIFTSIKVWKNHDDTVLSSLSRRLVDRKLFKVEIRDHDWTAEEKSLIVEKVTRRYDIDEAFMDYFVFSGEISNNAYNTENDNIIILMNDGSLQDITRATEQLNVVVISQLKKKYFFCYPKF